MIQRRLKTEADKAKEDFQLIENENRIRKAFKDRNWNEIKSSDAWVIFKVMAEFVDGFEKLGKIGPCVSVFGSARTKPHEAYYQIAEEIAAKRGYYAFQNEISKN